jgi:UDP-glucose 4-epimerase
MGPQSKTVIVTGGNGYIGSHLSRYLANLDNRVIVIDKDFEFRYGKHPRNVEYHQLDLTNSNSPNEVCNLLSKVPMNSIMVHLAAEKSVEDSIRDPDLYISNNVNSTRTILKSMSELGLRNLVFSSTAAVYAPTPDSSKVNESSDLMVLNPYAESKRMSEEDIASGNFGEFNYATMRFFNVAGADSKTSIEKDGKNLIPQLIRAVENDCVFRIYGNDYPTQDGTCVRDYIDVRDLIEAVSRTFSFIESGPVGILNIGNGVGYSVLDVVQRIQSRIPQLRYEFSERRTGDHAFVVADSSKAQRQLEWSPRYSLDDMIDSVVS